MKKNLFIFFFVVFAISIVSAQSNSGNEAFSLGIIQVPTQQNGQSNYLISLSSQDFTGQKYVFYTDSNAHVAYISINGRLLRLTGGYNSEHILAYSGHGYTVTLNKIHRDANGNVTAKMVVFDTMGKAVVKDVTGTQAN